MKTSGLLETIEEFEHLPRSFQKVQIIAHRGVHTKKIPENSMLGFRMAVDSGYGFETDVRTTKDEIAVCLHDMTLRRTCGLNRLVSHTKWKKIKDIELRKSKERLPTLEEVLEEFPSAPILLHIKSVQAAWSVHKLISQNDNAKATIVVQGLPMNIEPLRIIPGLHTVELHGRSSFLAHNLFGYFSNKYHRRALSLSLKVNKVLGAKKVLSDWPVIFRYTIKSYSQLQQVIESGALPISDYLPS